jgi:transcriptional regulator with XRE-family HTH domain
MKDLLLSKEAKALAEKIKKTREDMCLSQSKFVKKVNEILEENGSYERLNLRTLQQKEQKNRSFFATEDIIKMAMAMTLRMPLSDFYTNEEVKFFNTVKNKIIL